MEILGTRRIWFVHPMRTCTVQHSNASSAVCWAVRMASIVPDRDTIIAEELRTIHETLEPSAIKVAVRSLVQLEISRGDYARLVLQTHFPSTYPNGGLSCQLKSNTLPISALKKLEQLADNTAAECADKSEPAILNVHNVLNRVVQKNLLLVAFDEVQAIRSKYKTPGVKVSTRDVRGEVTIIVSCANYQSKGTFTVPPTYPKEACNFKLNSSDCPASLQTIFEATTREKGRKLIRPKLTEPPVVANTLLPMVRHFVDDLAGRYPKEVCPVCKKRMLPEITPDATAAQSTSVRFVRLWCGHLYDHKCLQNYLETPPFDKGKVCLGAGCGKRIFHQKFKTAGNVKLAEERWAHKMAHKREIQEIVSFLGVDDEHKKEQEPDDDYGAAYK